MYIYYDWLAAHTRSGTPDGVRCIAGAHLRLDGFVGNGEPQPQGPQPDGTDASAWIITRPVLRSKGPELTVNLEVVEEWAERECASSSCAGPDWTPIDG